MSSTSNPENSLPDHSDACRLTLALEEYMRLAEGGQAFDREAFLCRHASIRDELERCIDGLDLVEQLAPSLRDESTTTGEQNDQVEFPSTLGNYRIVREIGRGGMGVVYEAQQLSLGRRVALKVLPFVSLLDERQLRRFKNEARAAASLKHPNIVSVHDVGCERSVHFYAMELVEGADLATVIKRIHAEPSTSDHGDEDNAGRDVDTTPIAKLSTQRLNGQTEFYRAVAKIGIQAADALHFAHKEGVVHRDIKPANLLLDGSGQLHVADFGLAQFKAGDDLTLSGDLLGTLRYMSPEQVDGTPVVDQRTDVYSLGATLYEFVSGNPPFSSSERPELIRDVVEQMPRRLCEVTPAIPIDLATIIESAMSKERDERYQTISEMAADLSRFVENRTIRAKPPSMMKRAWKWCIRNRHVVAAAIVTVLFLTIGLAIALTQWRQALAAKELLSSEVYASNMLLAYESYQKGDIRGARQQFERALTANGSGQQQFELDYMSVLLDGTKDVTRLPCRMPTSLAFSQRGDAIFVAHVGGIDKWNLTTESRDWSATLDTDWSRDLVVDPSLATSDLADEVFAFGKHDILFINALSGNIKRRVKFDPSSHRPFRNVAMSADKKKVFATTNYTNSSNRDTEVHGYDLTTSATFQIREKQVGSIQAFAVDPNGRFIATSHRDHTVWLRDAKDWSLLRKIRQHRATVGNLDFSEDGRFLVSGPKRGVLEGWETQARIWDLEHDCEFKGWSQSQPGESVSLAPNAKRLATLSSTGAIEIEFLNTGRKLTFRGHSAPARYAAWSSDSRRLATADESGLIVWDIEEPSERSWGATNVMSLAIADETTAYISGENWEHDPGSMEISKVDISTGSTTTFADTAALPTSLSLDTANNRLYCTEYDGKSQVWDLSKPNHNAKSLQVPGWLSDSAVSQDGKYLAVGKYDDPNPGDVNRVEIWDVSSIPPKCVASHKTHVWPTAFAFSPSDRLLAFSDWNSNVAVVDARTQEKLFSKSVGDNISLDLAFSPDGKHLAVADSERRVWLWNTKTWESVNEPLSHAGVIFALAFSPDSTRLVTAAVDRTVTIWNVERQHLLARIHLEGPSISAIGFTPSGQRLVCAHMDRSVTVLHAPIQSVR